MTSGPSRHVAHLLFAAGTLVLLLAAVATDSFWSWLRAEPPLSEQDLDHGALARLWLVVTGGALVLASLVIKRLDLVSGTRAARATLVISALCLPLLVTELVLSPYVQRASSLYLRDRELGWKHRPGAEDFWHGVPIQINSKGLRGPEREHAKPDGAQRVLFLGDSVTFGFRNPDESKVLPAQVERFLSQKLDGQIECINGGVDGYSPWQSQLFLESEGLKYEPDLVVFSFVLNDVTEKMSLKRFGGASEGYQIEHGVLEETIGWARATNIGRFVRQLRESNREEEGPKPGELSAYALLLEPDSRPVQAAWQLTLQNIERIARTCREQKLPLLVVAFPYSIQILRPEFNQPQRILAQFCEVQQLAFLDLQPAIIEELSRLGELDEYFFMDAIHPTNAGYHFCAEQIGSTILARKWLTD
jgi:lysophospholipase L1-like esterase